MALSGKVCLVVGASSGVGHAVAIRCGKEGATVVACSRRMHLLNFLVEEIGSNATAVHMDVTDHKEVLDKVNDIFEKFGRIDILVYAAGIFTYSLIKNKFFEDWRKMIDTNCQGLVNVVASVFSEMQSRKIGGNIAVISSDAGRVPYPGLSVFCGTKFFVEGFLRSLRLESKLNDIVITSIQPGDVQTPSQQWTTDTEAAQLFSPLHCPPEQCQRAWDAMLKPEQVADAVIFALSQPKGTAVNEVLIQPITGPV
uniref:Dehydrogenase/reductase SDR family member 7B n=1 Tax=Ictalurus punctatus TaxID=7998 RepID=E3TG59_ICTPU|nr:uncharacterized protein LOC100528717 [Ictalurus punctatus]ADO29295.1 uncharacterized oxidoreductase ssp1627 [Ictalurus punctatus]